jgi:Putative prokaryotic signal transducing protein
MEKDWKRVFLSGQLYKVEIAKDLLENNGIESVIFNKKDSSYMAFGSIELYVNESVEEQAIELLKDLSS